MKKHDLKDDIGYWLNRLRMLVHQSFEERLAAYDITIAQWCVLLVLFNKQANSITDLARYIEVDKAAISRVIDKLIAKNLVIHAEGINRRSGKLSLTNSALELIPKLIQEAEENEKLFFGKLTTGEIKQLKKIFAKLFQNFPEITLKGWLENE